MSLTYEESLENYGDFYITVRDELKSNNISNLAILLGLLAWQKY